MNKSRYMDLKLYKFLNEKKVGKGEPFTHTEYGGNFGKYYIKDDELNKFLKYYREALDNGLEQFIVEYPKDVGPLCIDLDFNFEPDKKFKKRQYNEKHIEIVVEYINDIINKHIETEESKIKAYVSEKPIPSSDYNKQGELKRYKDGFHIVYPKIGLTQEMRYVLLDMCQQRITENNDFGDIKFTNSINDVFDKCVVKKNGWMMYGSRKKDGQLYEVTKVYNNKTKNIKIKDEKLEKILCIRKFQNDDVSKFKNTDNEEFNISRQKINKILSGKNKNSPNKNKKKVNDNNTNISDYIKDISDDEDDNDEYYLFDENKISDDEIEKIKKLVNILNSKRAYNYETWTEVGWCLRNIDKRLLDVFKSFSKNKLNDYLNKNPNINFKNYDEKGCEDLWNNARKNGKKSTIKSLYHWARIDNPTEYMKIIRSNTKNELLNRADSGTHYDVAKVVYKIFDSQYVCTSISQNKWYEFQKHRWIYVDEAYTLKRRISEELTSQLCDLSILYMEECKKNAGSMRDETLKKNDKIMKLINQLKTKSFKDSVISECKTLFFDPEFEEKLDSNKDLIGFDNGIYDLKRGIFREGVPEDYVTFSVGYNYKEFNKSHKYIKEINDFFDKVQPNKEMKEYLLYLFSSHLDGHNKKQRFMMFTGYRGSNGKSTVIDFLNTILGNYASSVPHTLLTRKRGSAGAATPELADKRGVRFIQIKEPSKNDEIEVGYMKELTGNDIVEARALYGEMFYFLPQFKFILVCNILPRINSNEGGTWRRVRAVPFDVEFLDTDQEIENPKMQYYKDYNIDEKMKKWKRAFMWYLLKYYYPSYRDNGIYEPSKVKECSNQYQKDSDFFYEFLTEYFVLTKNNRNNSETTNDVNSQFKTYVLENWTGGGNARPKKKDLEMYLEKNGFKVANNRVYGIKYKEIDNMLGVVTDLE